MTHEEKYIQTEIKDVFKTNCLQFDIDLPAFMKEVIENSDQKMYAKCWDIFLWYIRAITQRATELNDEVLNALMIRMNLYDVPLYERSKVLRELEKQYNKKRKKL